MKRYGRLDENLQGTLQKNRVFCAVMPIHDQRISRRTETRRLFELTKLKKAPSFVIVGLFSADHYLVPCLSLLSSECVVFTDVPRDFQRLAEYFSDGWRREGVIDSSCLFKIGAEVRTVRWKISNNTHPVPVLNNTHPFPSKCSVDALCRVRESVRFASERSRVQRGVRFHRYHGCGRYEFCFETQPCQRNRNAACHRSRYCISGADLEV